MKSFLLILLLWATFTPALPAENNPPPSTNPPLQQITADIFQLGQVRLDKKLKTVEFPTQLNMTNGLIEYLLVTTKGKTHESLLKTEVQPYQIHLAMLLIGAKGSTLTNQFITTEPFHVNQPGLRRAVIPGDAFTIELSWKTDEKYSRAENFIIDTSTKKTIHLGPWNYNGSRIVNGLFLAQNEGSIVAMVDDFDAMANNPRPNHDNDQIWAINTNNLPPANIPISVTFRLETKK